MKSLIKNIVIGATGLVLAAAPLAASAQSWHDRGGYVNPGGPMQRAGDGRHDRDDRDRDRDRDGWRDRYDARPVYQQAYPNGYFGWAPGGFQGYYWNGGWYQNRRLSGGVWIYF